MASSKELIAQRIFIKELETVSTSLAIWAQNCFENDWSLIDVKLHLRDAAKLCCRD